MTDCIFNLPQHVQKNIYITSAALMDIKTIGGKISREMVENSTYQLLRRKSRSGCMLFMLAIVAEKRYNKGTGLDCKLRT